MFEGRNDLAFMMEKTGFRVPEGYGTNLVGAALRLLRRTKLTETAKPWRRALRADRALPVRVLGPVLCREFASVTLNFSWRRHAAFTCVFVMLAKLIHNSRLGQ